MWSKKIKVLFWPLLLLVISVVAHFPAQLNGTTPEITAYNCTDVGNLYLECLDMVSTFFSTPMPKSHSVLITTIITTSTAEPARTTVFVNTPGNTQPTTTNSESTRPMVSPTHSSSKTLCYYTERGIFTPCAVTLPTTSPSATSKLSSGNRSMRNPLAAIYRLFSLSAANSHNTKLNMKGAIESTKPEKVAWTKYHVILLTFCLAACFCCAAWTMFLVLTPWRPSTGLAWPRRGSAAKKRTPTFTFHETIPVNSPLHELLIEVGALDNW